MSSSERAFMELAIARVGAILGPVVAGALQQVYRSPVPMFVSIGVSAVAAGAIILLARRPLAEQNGPVNVGGTVSEAVRSAS